MTRCWVFDIFDIEDKLADEMPNLFCGQVLIRAVKQ